MWMSGSLVDFEAGHLTVAKFVFRQHAGDRKFDRAGWFLTKKLAVRRDRVAARVTRVAEIDFLNGLVVAGDANAFGIHNDNKITAVNVRSVGAFAFSGEFF